MNAFLASWKTTVIAVLPLVAYGLKFVDLWPAAIPLPPFDQVWPPILAILGVGTLAKDNNVSGPQ